MKPYSTKDLEAAVMDWPIQSGACLMVHTALHTLGKPSGFYPKELPKFLFELLCAKVGETGTIVVPTFNFGFCSRIPYDIRNTPAEGMGAFSEFVRARHDSVRSPHAMQSICATGPHAGDLRKADPECAYSDQGAFASLLTLDATVVLIGTDFGAASLIHRAELTAGVPYRFMKAFEGTYIDSDGLSSTRTYTMHARMDSPKPILDLTRLDGWLEDDPTYAKMRLLSSEVRLVSARSLVNCVEMRLREDPLALLGNDRP